MEKLSIICKTIFWSALLFIALFLWTVTGGQSAPYEFRDPVVAGRFYHLIFTYTPLAILLTLFGTVKRHHDGARKALTLFSTLAAAALTMIFLFNSLFTLGFGTWTTFSVAYENRHDPDWQIREQRYDVGALGYGASRVVAVKPVLADMFWKVDEVDTTTIDKDLWLRVDREGAIKFP